MKHPAPLMTRAVAFLLLGFVVAGCSDQSRMNMYVDRITSSGGTVGYIEADWIGSANSHCGTIQDPALITVRLDSPGAVGPALDARTTGVSIDYYYSDPTDGIQRGPVAGLGVFDPNYRETLPANSQTTFSVPAVTYKVKAWAAGVPIAGSPTAAGGLLIRRMVAVVTISAEDGTGKKLSATGRVLIYLDDTGPYPVAPVPPAPPAAGDECYPFVGAPFAFWSGYY